MLNKGCPICGGDVYSEIDDYGVVEHRCFQAGHLVSDEHVQKVQADIEAIRQNLTKTKKEVNVKQDKKYCSLCRRWIHPLGWARHVTGDYHKLMAAKKVKK